MVITFTDGHYLWVVTRRKKIVPKISFLLRVAGVSVSVGVRSYDNQGQHRIAAPPH